GNSNSRSNQQWEVSRLDDDPMIDPGTGKIYQQWQPNGKLPVEVSRLGDYSVRSPTFGFILPPEPPAPPPGPRNTTAASGAPPSFHGSAATMQSVPTMQSDITGLGDSYPSRATSPTPPSNNTPPGNNMRAASAGGGGGAGGAGGNKFAWAGPA